MAGVEPQKGSLQSGLAGSENIVTKRSVLIVEDEADIREMVSYNFLKEGYEVSAVGSGEEALALVDSKSFDVVLLDLMLPGMDGLAVCRELKQRPGTRSAAIVVISAKRDETDVVIGLRFGADDYLTKPFSPRVLVARVEAVLRRTAANREESKAEIPESPIAIHDLAIHPGQHRVHRGGEPIELSRTEFQVLRLLAGKPGWVFTRQQILDGLYGERHAVADRAVDVQIVGLRKKLGPAGAYIETVRGVGYRFKE
jgi:two-component system alkaline phosphatase synthesis response regulator PhoP